MNRYNTLNGLQDNQTPSPKGASHKNRSMEQAPGNPGLTHFVMKKDVEFVSEMDLLISNWGVYARDQAF